LIKIKKRINNLKLLKIYSKSIQKWLNCYYDTFNHNKKYVLYQTYIKCSFCLDKNVRELELPYNQITKCFCPIHLCSYCYIPKEVRLGLSLFSELNDDLTFKTLKTIIKEMIFQLNQFKYINCFIWSE